MRYYPEGFCNYPSKYTKEYLLRAMNSGTVLEALALAYDGGQLKLKLGDFDAIIPHDECAAGVREGKTRDIGVMTRVGRNVSFVITGFCDGEKPLFTLSRAKAQRLCKAEYIDLLEYGDIIPCRVTHLEKFGAFCDVGCGIAALLPIDCISVSRIEHPRDRLFAGQTIYCAVKSRDNEGRLLLTMKELWGTWSENAACFNSGDTVIGVVRSRETYGIFVELTPNLAGLAEDCPEAENGQAVSVYIKSIAPEKMKTKLIILRTLEKSAVPVFEPPHPEYKHIDKWVYSPDGCERIIKTVFSDDL